MKSKVKQLSLSLCAGGIRSSPDPIHTTWLSGWLAAVWAPSCLLLLLHIPSPHFQTQPSPIPQQVHTLGWSGCQIVLRACALLTVTWRGRGKKRPCAVHQLDCVTVGCRGRFDPTPSTRHRPDPTQLIRPLTHGAIHSLDHPLTHSLNPTSPSTTPLLLVRPDKTRG